MASRTLVTGWVGSGTKLDPFRPDFDDTGTDSWAAIDLRPDGATDGFCLVVAEYPAASRTPTRDPSSTVDRLSDLGEDPMTELATQTRTRLATDLGVTVPNRSTIGDVVVAVLGDRLVPERDGVRRIRVGSRVISDGSTRVR